MMLKKKYLKSLKNSLYVIIDPDVCLNNPLNVTENAIKGGADIIQLRCKRLPDFEFLKLARDVSKICFKYKIPFLIDDRIDLAILVGADGVHLGQNDLPITSARKLLKNKIIGLSTHNEKEVYSAIKVGVDYISFGPVFKTNTKLNLPPVIGLKKLKNIRKFVKIPIMAIGGINECNAKEVIKAGADGVAIISAICKSKDVLKATRKIRKEVEKAEKLRKLGEQPPIPLY
ncbi:MAG: thiamine phosphate synthase [Candidatus Firestonebacteria bacterium]